MTNPRQPPLDTTSYWESSQALPRFSRLDTTHHVDVVIVGAGITGITAAYLLKREGLRVALVERGRCVEIDTDHTSGHLTCVTDTLLSDLVGTFGEDHARAIWDAGLAAIAEIDGIVRRDTIACGFEWVPGYLHLPTGSDQPDPATAAGIRRNAELAARLGFDVHYLEQTPFVNRPGLAIAAQARFHPRRYLRALLDRIDGDGSYVFEHTEVTEIKAGPLTVVAGSHELTCDDVVIATHNPIMGLANMASATFLQTKLSLYTSYVAGGRAPKGHVPDALFWDTSDPYRYLRIEPHRDFDYVIYGGEDHKTGQTDDTRECFSHLEAALRALVTDVDVTERWSGQVIETADGLPLIGYMAEHQYAATGFAGNGLTFGTLGAMMARDALTGRDNPWRDLFDIHRTGVRGGAWDYVKENKDYPYYMIRDRFAGVEGRSLRELPRDSGKILELDGARVAAYRAADGKVTLRSAVCTHMGCLVKWNTAERTWDCPCHGSRFAPDGHVISGPAETPLEEVPAKT